MAEQTFLKVLLAPCWDHNFPNGPHSWLDNVTAQPSGKVAPYQDNVDSNGRHVGDYYTGRRVANGDKFTVQKVRILMRIWQVTHLRDGGHLLL